MTASVIQNKVYSQEKISNQRLSFGSFIRASSTMRNWTALDLHMMEGKFKTLAPSAIVLYKRKK